ncbi:MAG: hypothetical protein KTR24_06290 [Saprospiraceae bacterium]|nr:hypothetical protein [Saprospiraceae bacterium]
MRLYLSMMLVCVSISVLAQGGDSFVSVDRWVDQEQKDSSWSLDEWTNHLIAPFDQQVARMRAIYRYVTTNIEYDDRAYRQGRRRINRTIEDVLYRQKAVCWGYAELVRAMCTVAKIPCVTVTGYAKDAPAPRSAYEKSNHAWNAVQIEGQWHLLDATWGASTLRGNTEFTLVDDIDYFLAQPDLLIHSHFPLMKMWQLQSCPVLFEDFLAHRFESGEEKCEYNYSLHIDYFLRLDYYEQQVAIVREAHAVNPTHANRKQIGHALVDVAVHRKELGDRYFDRDSVSHAVEEFEAATRIFDVAENLVDFYPWQTKSMVFAWANLVQALHREEAQGLRKHEEVKSAILQLQTHISRPEIDLELPIRHELEKLINGLLGQG